MEKMLEHLAALVAFDSRNPPRAMSADSPMFAYLRAQLPGFDI